MTEDALIFAFVLDGRGGGTQVSWPELDKWRPEDGIQWVHLDCTHGDTNTWLANKANIDPVIQEALTAEETRPRYCKYQNGLLLILRGVNLNPGADPEDMISIRLWIEENRIISARRSKILAIDDIRRAIPVGEGPKDVGEFILRLTDGLAHRMTSVISGLEDAIDEIEIQVLEQQDVTLRTAINSNLMQVIRLRRYLAPQREVINQLHRENEGFVSEADRVYLREVADTFTRYVEDLNASKDRIEVIHNELETRINTQMGKTMYLLTIIAAIFLPLGLLAGLLGINVGGIPWAENPSGFLIVSVALLIIGLVQLLVFRKMRWI
uniref:Zinc transporter n=1 Tax=Candidatus Kentrum sp. DK TaxID=2126562 RepID=A0A450S5L0_9GAMM|nr:MAG: zinc transporter [Candidatus Kentron sp. DK]VFJ58403.1 MAG: zinc transporter [Candidatus Kentron sp. DK]